MQYQELQEYDHASFTDRMQDGRDAADRNRARLAYMGASVTWKRPELTIWLSVEDAAVQLGVIERRVRALCKQRRIPGAKRLRTGKGRPWQIPAHRQPDGEYRVIVTPKTLGPTLRANALSPADLPF